MKLKVVIGSLVIAAALIFGAISFMGTTVEYADFQSAVSSRKRVQIKGEWVRGKESQFDAKKSQFSFYMKDDNNQVMEVVLVGAKPNNFEVANAIVVKGRYDSGVFHASECLTKCPSKYVGTKSNISR